jgi:predicted transcriptional regulator
MATLSKFSQIAAERRQSDPLERVKSTLDPASYEDFKKALADKAVSTNLLATILDDMGCRVSRHTLNRWRKELV